MIFFTADWHLGHDRLRKEYCPARAKLWKSVNEMDEALIRNCNETVGPDDTLYFIGDFALGSFFFQQRCCQALNVKNKILIRGNHDASLTRMKRCGFVEAVNELTIEIGGIPFTLNHFPFTNENPRFQARKPVDQGQYLLCGHVHDRWKRQGRALNVGCDNWDFRPVSEQEVLQWIM